MKACLRNGVMWRAQGALPQLRLPSLEESRDRMLRACEPLLSAEGYAQTCAAAETFAQKGGPAWRLQRELQELCVRRKANSRHRCPLGPTD